jgi:general secretion pathway protein L
VRGHGTARAARFNLRKGELAFKGDLDYLKGKTSRLAIFAAILIVLSGVLAWAQFHVLGKREARLDALLCTTTQKILGQCQKNYDVAINLLRGKSSPAAALPQMSALDLFAELTARSEKVSVKLTETEVQLERIRVRGETDGFEGVDKLVGQLKGFRCFPEIKPGKVQKTKDGNKVQFDLDIRVACPEEGTKEEGA